MSDGNADDLATLDIPARVARGATLLDEIRPGWWREINDDELDMQWCQECILGQVFGNYFLAFSQLPIPRFNAPMFGFDLPVKVAVKGTWEELATAWRAEIARRADAATKEVTA
jgi:hypothetical protein